MPTDLPLQNESIISLDSWVIIAMALLMNYIYDLKQ